MKLYAGIGSRKTPQDILDLMSKAAVALDAKGYTLVSGGATGADQAFASRIPADRKIIYTADDATPKAIIAASYYHPAWDRCNSYTRKLHGRNMMILLGKNLDTDVKFILCWTEGGLPMGGTGQAIRAAKACKIPVYNLFHTEIQTRLKNLINEAN